MLSAVVNKPNRILEKQKMVQSDHRPIWYRLPRSRVYLGVYFTLFTVGIAGSGYGLYSLVKGKPTAK